MALSSRGISHYLSPIFCSSKLYICSDFGLTNWKTRCQYTYMGLLLATTTLLLLLDLHTFQPVSPKKEIFSLCLLHFSCSKPQKLGHLVRVILKTSHRLPPASLTLPQPQLVPAPLCASLAMALGICQSREGLRFLTCMSEFSKRGTSEPSPS